MKRVTKRFYTVFNPRSGRGKGARVLSRISPLLEAGGLELTVIETGFPGHARELARQLDFGGYSGLIVIGGDGTMHEIVNGLLTRSDQEKIPVGLIPAGSGNAFMYDLDLLDPLAAARTIREGHTRPVDVAEIRSPEGILYAFNIIGWGLVTDIARRAERWRWLGPTRYTIASLFEILRCKPRRADLLVGGKKIIDDFVFVLACNTRYTGKGMKAAPKAKLDDGLIDVMVVRRGASRLKILATMPRIYSGSHADSPLAEFYPVSEFSLVPKRNEVLNIDGDIHGSTPIQVKMIPGGIEVFAQSGQ